MIAELVLVGGLGILAVKIGLGDSFLTGLVKSGLSIAAVVAGLAEPARFLLICFGVEALS